MLGTFTTQAPGQGTSQMTFDWSAPTGMQYSSSSDMSNAVALPPSSRQSIPVGSNSVVYAQVGAAGPITILIAP